jgi:hypothetical protein
MNGYFRNAVAVLALVAGTGFAAAAGMSNPASTSDHLNLSSSQQKEIWQDVSTQATKETAPSSFKAALGAVTPTAIKLQPLPTKASTDVPVVKSYDYAMLQNQVLIVDPSSRKIVDIVRGS